MSNLINTLKAISCAVYMILFCLLLISVKGPTKQLFKNGTKFETDEVTISVFDDASPIPEITLCIMPGLRFERRQFANWSDAQMDPGETFQEYLHRNLYYPASEFINELQITANLVDRQEIPLENLTINTIVLDLIYYGYCYTINVAQVRGTFNRHFGSEYDSAMIIYRFKTKEYNNETYDVTYNLFVHQRGEAAMFAGAQNIVEAEVQNIGIQARLGLVLALEPQYQDRMSDCNEANELFSTCVMNYVDEKFGGCTEDKVGIDPDCTAQRFIGRMGEIQSLKIAGLTYIKKQTGCMLPCQRYTFDFTEVMRDSYWKMNPDVSIEDITNDAALYFRVSTKPKMKRTKEIYSYNFGSWVSDFGGQLGLFLGLSFWDVYMVLRDIASKFFMARNP